MPDSFPDYGHTSRHVFGPSEWLRNHKTEKSIYPSKALVIASDSAPKRSDADYAAEFRHELEEAVRIRLRADVPVGVYLSGGLDFQCGTGAGRTPPSRSDSRIYPDLR